MTLHLPDVSEYQRNVDWTKVAHANGGAAIVRAYNGRRADKLWPARRAAAHHAGVGVLGIYAYLVADRPAIAQAVEFVKLVGVLRPGEFVILDLESGSGNQLARAEAFLNYVDRRLTYPGYHGAWLYSYGAYFAAHGLLPITHSARHTWVAGYSAAPPSIPHTLWQHTDAQAWPGIGRCDCSIFVGSLAELRAKVYTAPVVKHAQPVKPAPVAPKRAPAPSIPPCQLPARLPATWLRQLVAAILAALRGTK